MNTTQVITRNWLVQSNLNGDALLLEALLRRGFLAFRNDQGVWLGTGSHPADLTILQWIDGLEVEAVLGEPDKFAAVKIQPAFEARVMDVAVSIIGIPENHDGRHGGHWTRFGVGPFIESTWEVYCDMVWGAKLSVCPALDRDQETVCGALDLGIALLVKALPLARVATSLSCDGHGTRPVKISFHFPWDVFWGEAVFQTLGVQTPSSEWDWTDDHLQIRPLGRFDDASVIGMLNDIQKFARKLLNREVIKKIGDARAATLTVSMDYSIVPEAFAFYAKSELKTVFSKKPNDEQEPVC